MMSGGWHDYLTTREVADYLRIKERRVYELVRQRAIPCTRVTGKWLFPRAMIDRWLAANLESDEPSAAETPPVIAGSHDPLLEWAVGESGCGLALKGGGSLDGLDRLRDGEARVAAMHVHDPEADSFNVAHVRAQPGLRDVVVLTWAWRRQGLVLPAGNPDGVQALADLVRHRVPVAQRQAQAGSRLLFETLLDRAGFAPDEVNVAPEVGRTEMAVGLSVLSGAARAGFAIEAVARSLNLDFLPLAWERFDLVLGRRDAFEPPFQSLLRFGRSEVMGAKAEALGGYDLGTFGQVQYNAP
jgi:excisionase family DNA binding protein